MKKIKFGVLSTSKIAIEKVIPALQSSSFCEVTAIASRNLNKAKFAANKLGIGKTYGDYEELLNDPDIEAVYIPLPNHMHVPWSIRSLHANKHVLCEKPIGLDTADAEALLKESRRFPELKVMEAFMYRHHPRWNKTVELIRSGTIGRIKTIHSLFSYYNTDPENIRNSVEMGGGGLMDIGCYSISVSRWLFDAEPRVVKAAVYNHPDFKTDILASGILGFEEGTSIFSCSTQCFKDQYVAIYGDKGKIELDWPFNPSFNEPTRLVLTVGDKEENMTFDSCNHFTLQADEFARAILDDRPVASPLEDSVRNMEVIDRCKASALK